jgi:hypothetical protein
MVRVIVCQNPASDVDSVRGRLCKDEICVALIATHLGDGTAYEGYERVVGELRALESNLIVVAWNINLNLVELVREGDKGGVFEEKIKNMIEHRLVAMGSELVEDSLDISIYQGATLLGVIKRVEWKSKEEEQDLTDWWWLFKEGGGRGKGEAPVAEGGEEEEPRSWAKVVSEGGKRGKAGWKRFVKA